MPIVTVAIKVSKEQYIKKCNEILANIKLTDKEKIAALVLYASKVKIINENQTTKNRPNVQ